MSTEIASLSAIDARVLGCLIEKQAATPDQYPLTVNSLVLACNQKTSREPIMNLEPGAVLHCLRDLEHRELVARAFGGRVERFEHRFDKAYKVTLRQQALLALLMLRGPQTLNELFTRSDRLSDFAGPEDVRHTLDRLAEHEPSLVQNIGRGNGQREDRYAHLLSGSVDVLSAPSDPDQEFVGANSGGGTSLRDEVAALKERVATLEAALADIKSSLGI
ncbi:DUF480 domain-containing protein [Ahniella affigens]|uniref:DUF480 domain-containing protein n=1 Tax=Ahniella affigens TaxID=2021234 RepID=A0A2P1PXR0_9GAMM|nr:DUF480 domain-containing protein [Ahniella affigens]AVP99625.1 DUF480 domain-containing protein [Ahniella affigens]